MKPLLLSIMNLLYNTPRGQRNGLQTPSSVNATVSTPSTSTSDNKSQRNGIIVGASLGGIVFIAILVFVIYLCCKKYKTYQNDKKHKKRIYKKNDVEHINLIQEFQNRSEYISKKNSLSNDASYLSLSRNTDTEHPIYDNDVVDKAVTPSKKNNKTRGPPPSKPMPLPKPTKITSRPSNGTSKPANLKSSSSNQTNNSTNSKLSSSSFEGRKPMPLPRPQTLGDKEADNALYGSTGEIYKAADNIVYAPVEECSQQRPEYEQPDENIQLKSGKLGSSAQLFNVSDFDSQNEGKQFALYVEPVTGSDVVYKVPSNVEKFDPPKDENNSSSGDESYTDMTGDDYTDMSGGAYVVTQGGEEGEEYIDMQGDQNSKTDEIYTNMDGGVYEPPCEHLIPPSKNEKDTSSEDDHAYDDVEEIESALKLKKGKKPFKTNNNTNKSRLIFSHDSSEDENSITV